MKKTLFIIGGIIIIFIFIIFSLRFIIGGPEDDWICQNGQWIKHGNPRVSQPIKPCENNNQQEEPDIVVFSPQTNQVINSPIQIKGKARGSWFFEAVFPVRLIDTEGKELAVGYVEATNNWMTNDFVPFRGELKFISAITSNVVLILEKDNPSDLPENAGKIEIPITITPTETLVVKIFFNNDMLDPEFSCFRVFPVEREILKTLATARAALEELLKGPSDEEKSRGYFTNINPNVKIQKLSIEEGIAKVDFDEQLEFQMGGSCRVSAIRHQIIETLKQFSTVKEVVISINGRTEDILQP